VLQPYRRIPIPLEEKVNRKIEELIDQDIIKKVEGPSEWIKSNGIYFKRKWRN